ncbi:hypothetical protein BYT27DRAFT_6844143 [Phlegmacium glaucopus]|nr:hypothetical protein BYT27DRAFT_6844143 [Phlegmacium glaucopus]
MITTPPLCKLHQNLDSASTQPFCDACSSSSTTFGRRNLSTAGMPSSSGRSLSLYAPDTVQAPSLSTRTAIAMPEWEIDPLQNPMPLRTPKSRTRPQTSSGIPSFRPPIPILEEELEVDAVEPSASKSKDNSWYTANPYDVTPRFSRLGLSASGVVMPLSPKEHRRLSSTTRTTSNGSTSNSTSPTTKRFSIVSARSPKSPPISPTRISLQPPAQSHPPSSRTVSATSSETSSIASQRETRTPISASTSAPSLTRSRNSGDSLSTSYESCPPTPLPERNTVLPTEEDEEERVRDKREVNDGGITGGIGIGAVEEFHGHRYSDVTLKNDSSDAETQPDQGLARIEQPEALIYPDPQHQLQPQSTSNSNPTYQPTTNPPIQTPTFPKVIKKGRDSQRKQVVRVKLQPVDLDDLEGVQSSFSTVGIKTTAEPMTAITTTVTATATTTMTPLTTPTISTTKAEVGEREEEVTVDSEETLTNVPPLPSPILKKKKSTFKSIWKSFFGRR